MDEDDDCAIIEDTIDGVPESTQPSEDGAETILEVEQDEVMETGW